MRHPYEEYWQGKPYIGNRANGGFTSEEIKGTGELFLDHAVHVRSDNTVALAQEDERIDGFFVEFEGGDLVIYRFQSKGCRARNGGTDPIPLGSKLVGAEKTNSRLIASYPQCGYVKAVDFDVATITSSSALPTSYAKAGADTAVKKSIDDALALFETAMEAKFALLDRARGIVRGPIGTGSPGNTYPPADVIVEFGGMGG